MGIVNLKKVFCLARHSERIFRSFHVSQAAAMKRHTGLVKEDGQAVSDAGAARENAYFRKLELDMLQRLKAGRHREKRTDELKKQNTNTVPKSSN